MIMIIAFLSASFKIIEENRFWRIVRVIIGTFQLRKFFINLASILNEELK